MLKTKRKVILTAKRYPSITLPIQWARFFKLKRKQPLLLLGNQVLVIFPPNHQKELEKKVREFLMR